jgi:hypothetical protein
MLAARSRIQVSLALKLEPNRLNSILEKIEKSATISSSEAQGFSPIRS